MIKGWIRKMNRLASFLAIFALITACGGGGGSDSGGGFVPPSEPEGASLDISLTDIQGNTITEITPVKQGVFRIAVSDAKGQPVAQEVVSASTTMGRIVPESGTALTDEQGVAIIYVAEDGIDGAGTLTATLTLNDVTSEGSKSFSITTALPAETRRLGHIDSSGTFVEGKIKVQPSGTSTF